MVEAPTGPLIPLPAVIDERTSFATLLPITSATLDIDCSAVVRINSAGFKAWILHLRTLRTAGGALRFHRCSPAMIHQMNLFPGSFEAGEVHSLFVPFHCSECKSHVNRLYSRAELESEDLSRLTTVCDRCGRAASLDDTAEEYFLFLRT